MLLILLALCLFESERRSTQRVAGGALGFLLVLMVGGALFKVGDAPLEPLYLILLAVFLFTAFFDPDVRPGLIVAGSMPLSALFCFLLFQACGITLNVMSLFGLALGMGMLVDNATVVYENLTHKNLGPPGPAARKGPRRNGGNGHPSHRCHHHQRHRVRAVLVPLQRHSRHVYRCGGGWARRCLPPWAFH
ncbi:MAG: efflux RND transporter permease subunit [Elusimicrobia bacterium]|nr:efflux RND transporter permease subunit [Elusimicrobiota bacterium]